MRPARHTSAQGSQVQLEPVVSFEGCSVPRRGPLLERPFRSDRFVDWGTHSRWLVIPARPPSYSEKSSRELRRLNFRGSWGAFPRTSGAGTPAAIGLQNGLTFASLPRPDQPLRTAKLPTQCELTSFQSLGAVGGTAANAVVIVFPLWAVAFQRAARLIRKLSPPTRVSSGRRACLRVRELEPVALAPELLTTLVPAEAAATHGSDAPGLLMPHMSSIRSCLRHSSC